MAVVQHEHADGRMSAHVGRVGGDGVDVNQAVWGAVCVPAG